jgi:hypothetical protein
MTNQGKLLIKLNPSMLGFLNAYFAWSIEPYGSKLSNVKISFFTMSQYCVQKYLVCKEGPKASSQKVFW